MNFSLVLFLAVSSFASAASLTQVYSNNDFQITGISVSKAGRLFVNFPRWSDHYLYAVAEVSQDGSLKPFPNKDWNQWNLKPDTVADHFVCVQSVVVDGSDALWVLDAAAPLLGPAIPSGPKMVRIDLKTNQVSRVIPFGPDVAKPDTYLNDVRFDLQRNTAYITDSGHGGLIIVELKTGKAHRALDGDPSVMTEPGVGVSVDGKPLLQFGKPPQFRVDSLELSKDGQYVYYKAITADTLYRVKTDVLRDSTAPVNKVSAAVEKVAKAFPTDGLWMDGKGTLYLSDLTHNAVAQMPPGGSIHIVVQDSRLQWPDTFTEGPDGYIYVSASHINDGPSFNQGKSVRKQPYGVFKFKP